MNEMCFFELRQRPRWKEACAAWCAEKWSVPLEAYRESMAQALEGRAAVPAWYFCADGPRIVAGLGVIENDFHPRRDLAPNVCAVFTEPAYRSRGIAGRLLALACADMEARGVDTLYLLTDHTGFYERYGWEFLCPVTADGEECPSRMYVHRQKP